MTDKQQTELPNFRWIESRLPARDALAALVPDGTDPDPAVTQMQARVGGSRWYPTEGGHRVLIPYGGGEYDASRFTIEPGAWDHEHCDLCRGVIPPMTVCYVTDSDHSQILLCADCYRRNVTSKQR